jgi:hypothetical protein
VPLYQPIDVIDYSVLTPYMGDLLPARVATAEGEGLREAMIAGEAKSPSALGREPHNCRMARIYPNDVTRALLGGARRSEIDTLLTLQSRLSDDYAVFHSVHWTREFRGDTVYGEVDFAVVNRAGLVLIIEQKNGVLENTEHGLVARYADGTKNVADQLHRALDSVRAKFAKQHPHEAKLHLEYLVYCPDFRLTSVNAAGLDAGRIVDARMRDRLAEWIEHTLGPGRPPEARRAELVEGFFRQRFDLAPDIHSHITSQERTFARQAGGFARVVDALDMAPFRLRINGVAGSGKTMVARHVFDATIAATRRPLFVCFNRPLSERVRVAVTEGGVVKTWYGLCAGLLRSRGHQLDFDGMREPGFWEGLTESVIGETIPDEWMFDTLVVDEGQDFEQLWADMLFMLLRPGGRMFWFEDPDQNVRQQPTVRLDRFVTYRARTNYRTPRSIATLIGQAFPDFDFETGSELPGLGVGVTTYDEEHDQVRIVARLVRDLLKQGFRFDDIVVLTTRHMTPRVDAPLSILSSIDSVGNYRLRRFTAAYDLLGRQVVTEGQLTFDSVTRFKGQERPAVILIDVDPELHDPELYDRVLLSGMTRATVRLELVVRNRGSNVKLFGR